MSLASYPMRKDFDFSVQYNPQETIKDNDDVCIIGLTGLQLRGLYNPPVFLAREKS